MGILLALLLGIVYVLHITVLFRAFKFRRPTAVLFTSFVASVPIYILLYLLAPPELLRLTERLDTPRWLDAAFGLLLYCAGVLGGVVQLYNLAERGFSLRILIDIMESPRQALSEPEIMTGYSQGR